MNINLMWTILKKNSWPLEQSLHGCTEILIYSSQCTYERRNKIVKWSSNKNLHLVSTPIAHIGRNDRNFTTLIY